MKVLFKLSFIILFMINTFFPKASFSSSGAYLAAASAVSKNDYSLAVEYYDKLLKSYYVTDNVFEEALIFSLISGNTKKAQQLSILMDEKNISSSLSLIVLISKLVFDKDYYKAQLLIKENYNKLPNLYVETLYIWFSVFVEKNFKKDNLKKIEKYDFSQSILSYQKAIAFALKNDFETSARFFDFSLFEERNPSENEILAWIQILSQNNEFDKAKKFLNIYEGNHKYSLRIENIKKSLYDNRKISFNIFPNPWDSIADVLYQLSTLKNENNSNFVNILYLRIASFNSKNDDIYFFSLGNELKKFNLFELSNIELNKIKKQSSHYFASKMIIIDNYLSLGQNLNAQLDLKKLLKEGYYEYEIFESLGDTFRLSEDYENAVINYTFALDELNGKEYKDYWFLYFVRGISYEQNNQWTKAKLDLEKSLEFRPNQPQVLNYLGYSLIEKKGDLNKALELLEKALRIDPKKGYIIDSYAWCLFKLGRIEESLSYMEKAVELEPTDPVVNDHFGDVLWKVGRKREAFFQWKRALSLNPIKKNAEKIQMKIQNGFIEDN